MPLAKAQLARLSAHVMTADRSGVQSAISQLSAHWKRGSWLAQNNRYRTGASKEVRRDVNSGRAVAGVQLAQYVAASAIAHCYDGWSYLGRALEAEMAADPGVAIHLAYYAELRAAMSLLASEGIGVFDSHHAVVSKNGTCQILSGFGKTHEFVWHALDLWAGSQAGASTVVRSITPNEIPLSDWLSQFSLGGRFLSTLLQEWGLDLSRLASDRSARNVASYQPTAFSGSGPRAVDDTIRGILQFWEVCEPGPSGGFPILDRHLLRRSLELGWHGPATTYQSQLKSALNGLPLVPEGVEWLDFLSHEKLSVHHKLIEDASGNVLVGHPKHSEQVLARATLLLRVATGTLADLLSSAGANVGVDLDFWLSSRSVCRRLWPESNQRATSSDLWSDVEEALNSVDDWLENRSSRIGLDHHTLWMERSQEACILSTTERLFLSGLCA